MALRGAYIGFRAADSAVLRGARMSTAVRVEVLGPLRLLVAGDPVEVRGSKRRAMLALLALAEGRTVPVDQLVDALGPGSGRQSLHVHVSRLRALLGPAAARLETGHDGYRLLLDGGLDVAQARSLLTEARGCAERDPAGAFALLDRAYALWRGPVLADLTDVAAVAVAVQSCAHLYREVVDALIASAIAAGQAERVVGLAAEARAADPLREPAVLLLMRALAATGRAPEALDAGRQYRERLAEETGLDPSPALDHLVRDIASGAAGAAGAAGAGGAAGTAGAAGGSPRRPVTPAGPTTRLIGREAQIAALRLLLAGERLVTVVGPGGVGKTRVVMETARGGGTATVLPLAPVTEPAVVPHALASALGLDVTGGDVLSACLAVLNDRGGLLVIDNCEHLLDAVHDTVGAVLSACPRVRVLATSREPLGLPDEHVYRLDPLPLPRPDQDPRRAPSVEVFLDRAGRVRAGAASTPAGLRLVADIVERLDGIPLAIELAAGRLSTLSLADLHQRLDRSLDLLGRPTGDARHRTLRATVEWSYRLLTHEEQRLFRTLSVFVDGVDLAAAERLAADLGLDGDPGSLLARLVDASMVTVQFEGGTRYRMLATLRTFGLDRLADAGEAEAAGGYLLRWAVELCAWIGRVMTTEREPEADAVLRRELPNLRTAWRLARGRGALDDAAAMVLGLFDALVYRDLIELRGWAEELADDPALVGHPRAAALLGVAAEAAYHRGDHPRADQLARAGLHRAKDSWHCMFALSVADLARGAYADALEHSLAAAALAGRPRENLGIAALAAAYAGDLDRARVLNERGLAGAVSPTMLAWGAYVAAEIESLAGHGGSAERHYVHAVDLARTSGATFLVGVATVGLVAVRARSGRVHDALRGYGEVVDYFARTGNWTHQWVALRNLADLLRRLGDPEPAALLDAAADGAPDAPADRSRDLGGAPRTPVADRATVLATARLAIERHLDRSP